MFLKSMMISAVAAAAIIAQGSGFALADGNSPVSDPHFQMAPGYVWSQSALPDSLALLGPPPADNSAAFARDEEARAVTMPLRGTARWALARLDADLDFPQPAKNYSCALGAEISQDKTPAIYRLMQKVLTDAGLSGYGAKDKYKRTRPFVAHNEGTCFPAQEDTLRTDGSYPSGHTAAGWAWALVLSEISPTRADTILARGLSFGQSRVICNAHWQSDVDAGRIMGAATVAKLHGDLKFLKDLELARQELDTAPLPDAGRCKEETDALAMK